MHPHITNHEETTPQHDLTVGRIVHYTLSAADVERAMLNRDGGFHQGHDAHEGDVVPLLVVKVNPDGNSPTGTSVNGQAFLDGNYTLWVLEAYEIGPDGLGPATGVWSWPPRVE